MPHLRAPDLPSRISPLQRVLAASLITLLVVAGVALTPFAANKLMLIPSDMLAFGFRRHFGDCGRAAWGPQPPHVMPRNVVVPMSMDKASRLPHITRTLGDRYRL